MLGRPERKNMRTCQWKERRKRKAKRVSLPINVVHCVKEDTGASPGIDHNTIHRDMPTLVVGVVVVDVPPPCCETMISFPHEKHLPTEMCKIRILLHLDIELCRGFLPERAPWGYNGRWNREVHGNVVENRNVHYPISLSISHNKLTLQTLHLYHADWTDKREDSQATQGNGEAGLTGGLSTKALNNTVRVLLLRFAELKLRHNRISVDHSNNGIIANRHHLPCISPYRLAISTWAASTSTTGATITKSSTDWCCSSATSKDSEP